MDNAILIVSFSSLLTGVVAYAVWKNGSKLPLPPGPPAWPILGNVLDIPATEPWIAYKRLSEKRCSPHPALHKGRHNPEFLRKCQGLA
ncbi:hypothetical protein BS17DRAFT_120832 [Gyrodon lividus]|nr:hypothetical protein BS17DRAFT_120832 [Gyrodon lividus]